MANTTLKIDKGTRVTVYAPDHKHYNGTARGTVRGGRLVRVMLDRTGPGEYAGTTDLWSADRVTV